MPYHFIGRDPNNGALRGFEEFLFGGEWKVKTKLGTEPLAYRLTNGFLFRAHEQYGDARPGEPAPPRPVPDPATTPNDFDAYISEKRYGTWSIQTAYWFASDPAVSSADLELKSQNDPDFRAALDASEGLLIPAAPLEMRTPAKEEKRYTTFAMLNACQQRALQAKRNFSSDVKFALRIDRRPHRLAHDHLRCRWRRAAQLSFGQFGPESSLGNQLQRRERSHASEPRLGRQ